jgi:hypothetical protein
VWLFPLLASPSE